MKKVLFILLVTLPLVLSGCSSPEKKAQKLINQQLKETLHDWNSYESVKFESLDSAYTTVMDIPEYAEVFTKVTDLGDKMKKAHKEMTQYESMGYLFKEEMLIASQNVITYASELKKMQHTTDSIFNIFIPEFNGWSMQHSFRANNLAGNRGIHHREYYFDKDLTEILYSEDIGEK